MLSKQIYQAQKLHCSSFLWNNSLYVPRTALAIVVYQELGTESQGHHFKPTNLVSVRSGLSLHFPRSRISQLCHGEKTRSCTLPRSPETCWILVLRSWRGEFCWMSTSPCPCMWWFRLSRSENYRTRPTTQPTEQLPSSIIQFFLSVYQPRLPGAFEARKWMWLYCEVALLRLLTLTPMLDAVLSWT
jgi:hypothetical protein